jgi:hypothetical protein
MDNFTRGYITAALWSSMDESDPSGGDPMDKNYDISDIAPATIKQMEEDCRTFQANYHDLLDEAAAHIANKPLESTPADYLGHDFWLTRNGHGCGFWDGDYPKQLGDELTKASKEHGEYNLYVGDDGLIYGTGG